MVKLEELWKSTVFDKDDVGEAYCEMLISKGKSEPLIDLPSDAQLPSFYDRRLFERAQKFYHAYSVFIGTTNAMGVMILFGVETILDILVCTKQSSSPETAYKRYAETMLLIENLYKDSPEDPNSLCSQSLRAIRKKHKHGSAMGVRRTNQFINQRDMAITQNSFMGHVIVYYKRFGIPYEPENLIALCHFWRVIGYMIGIEDRFNLCAGDLTTITLRCQALFRHIIVPGVLFAPQNFQMMTEAYFDGLLGVSTDFQSTKMIFMTKRMSNVPGFYLTEEEREDQLAYTEKYPHYIPESEDIRDMKEYSKRCRAFSELKWSHRWDILFTEFLLLSVVPRSAFARGIFNFIHSCRLFLLVNFPILGMLRFGVKKAFVKILDD